MPGWRKPSGFTLVAEGMRGRPARPQMDIAAAAAP